MKKMFETKTSRGLIYMQLCALSYMLLCAETRLSVFGEKRG